MAEPVGAAAATPPAGLESVRQTLIRSTSNPATLRANSSKAGFNRSGKGGNRAIADTQHQPQPQPRSPSSSAMANRVAKGATISSALTLGGEGRSAVASESSDPTTSRSKLAAGFGNPSSTTQRLVGADRPRMNALSRILDGRRGNARNDDGEGSFALAKIDTAVTGMDDVPRTAGHQGFREGDLECQCVYYRQFPLNHRLLPTEVLTSLGYVNLAQFAIDGRSNLYVYRDKHRHVFYMKLSEVRKGV